MKKVLIIILIFLALNLGLGTVLSMITGEPEYPLEYGIEIGYKLLLIAGVLYVIYKTKVELILWNKKYLFWVISLGLVYLAVNSLSDKTAEIPLLNHTLFFMVCVTVAIFEEYLFRVYVFDALLKVYTPKKMIRVILITSALFALAHGGNALRPGVHIYGVIVQIVFAFGIGIFLQALLFRFKNVILIITIHALINYLGSYKSQLLFLERVAEEYTLNDFIMSLGIMMGMNIVIVLPISYLLLQPLFKAKNSSPTQELT